MSFISDAVVWWEAASASSSGEASYLDLPFARRILGHEDRGTHEQGSSRRRRSSETGAAGPAAPPPIADREEPAWLRRPAAAAPKVAAKKRPSAAPKAVAKRPAAAAPPAAPKAPAKKKPAAAAREEADEEAPVDDWAEEEEEAAGLADRLEDAEEEVPREVDQPIDGDERPIEGAEETMQVGDDEGHEARLSRRRCEGYSIIQARLPRHSWSQVLQFSDKQFATSTSHGRTPRQQCDFATKDIFVSLLSGCCAMCGVQRARHATSSAMAPVVGSDRRVFSSCLTHDRFSIACFMLKPSVSRVLGACAWL